MAKQSVSKESVKSTAKPLSPKSPSGTKPGGGKRKPSSKKGLRVQEEPYVGIALNRANNDFRDEELRLLNAHTREDVGSLFRRRIRSEEESEFPISYIDWELSFSAKVHVGFISAVPNA